MVSNPFFPQLFSWVICAEIFLWAWSASLWFDKNFLSFIKSFAIVRILLWKRNFNVSLHLFIEWLRDQVLWLVKHIHKENHISFIQQNGLIDQIMFFVLNQNCRLRVVWIPSTVHHFVEVNAEVNQHESLNHDREYATEMGLVSVSVFVELKLNLVPKDVKFFDVREEAHFLK